MSLSRSIKQLLRHRIVKLLLVLGSVFFLAVTVQNRLRFTERETALLKFTSTTHKQSSSPAIPLIRFVGEHAHKLNVTVPSDIPLLPSKSSLPPLNFTSPTAKLHAILRSEYNYSKEIWKTMDELVQKYPQMADARVNACIFILCRNEEVDGVISSIISVDQAFNSKYLYPYVLVNDVPFTEKFKNRVKAATRAPVDFGLVPVEHWSIPSNIDHNKLDQRLKELSKKISYGGSKSYRFMCRYNSRFFYKHPLVQKYRYYLRVEPKIKYHCKWKYDPFLFMALYGKKYAFTIVAEEFMDTVKGLWKHTASFMEKENIKMSPFMRDAFYDAKANDFNSNHYWSNFEMGDMDFYRSPIYERYMEHLEESQGFFMERYGDAPVHSLAVGMLLKPHETHYFADMSYEHNSFFSCPREPAAILDRVRDFDTCSCDRGTYWIDSMNVWGKHLLGVLEATNKHWNMTF